MFTFRRNRVIHMSRLEMEHPRGNILSIEERMKRKIRYIESVYTPLLNSERSKKPVSKTVTPHHDCPCVSECCNSFDCVYELLTPHEDINDTFSNDLSYSREIL
jgi:hypothetical protein